jgi:hypothetical protein
MKIQQAQERQLAIQKKKGTLLGFNFQVQRLI